MNQTLKVLHVEDSEDDSALLLRHLKKSGFLPFYERVDHKEALESAIQRDQWDIIICDYNMPRFTAFEALRIAKAFSADLPFVVVSGSIGEENAVDLMRAGASDYIMKDNLTRLEPVLRRELKESEQKTESRRIEAALKTSESNLLQAQKLESIGLLAGGIAHDFNNVLAVITLHSEFLWHELDDSMPGPELVKKVKRCLDEIKKSSERATSLTSKLLSFSRKQKIQPLVVNLNTLVFETREMLKRMLPENIQFNIDVASDLKNIYVDRGQIEQILLNLIINARDAMPQGGLLTITTKNVSVGEKAALGYSLKAGHYIVLGVRDSGIGMNSETVKNIFEPFFTTKPIGKGTGLGLSTVYGIMQQSKGRIHVESEVGKGTCFELYFPATDEAVQSPKSVSRQKDSLFGAETILVVEDEAGLKEVLSEVLKKHGYNVLTASNGKEALDVMKINSDIKLVITDVVMPHMGGAELARQASDINKNTKFLFQSGYLNDTLNENGIDIEKINFIQKPYKPDALLSEIQKILRI